MAMWAGIVFTLTSTLFGQKIDLPSELVTEEQDRIAVIARASQATVCVFDRNGEGGGSGVLVSPEGFALTNFHVVQPCGKFMKCGLNDGRLYDAVVVGVDPTGDVALIKLFGRDDFPVAPWGDSDQVVVGEPCFAVGNPFLLAHDFQPTVTWGIVSGINRYQYPDGGILEYADSIQTDAAINPGNSGGPLFNRAGEVIGINGRGSFEKRGRVNVGVGYAVSINQIKRFYSLLKGGRIVDHATLGATVRGRAGNEVRVSNLLETSDAYRQGLRFDDRLVKFAEREVSSTNQFKNILGTYPREFRVPLEVERDGELIRMIVELAGVNDPQVLDDLVHGDAMPRDSENGESTDDDMDELARFFERRIGFANYYFNRRERERVWRGFVGARDVTQLAGKWQIDGNSGLGGSQFLLDDAKSGLKTPTMIELFEDRGAQTALESSGPESRWLAGMHLIRRLIVRGPERFGDLTYGGVFPLPERKMNCEVLTGTLGSVSVRFYFSHNLARLECVEIDDLSERRTSRLWLSGERTEQLWPLSSEMEFEIENGPRQRFNQMLLDVSNQKQETPQR
jgi:serine protease Do